MKHNNLKRLILRICEEIKATYDVAKVVSIKGALITLRAKVDIQLMNRNGYKEPPSVKERLIKKHQIMLEFLENKYKLYWDEYNYSQKMPDCDINMRNKIWICWWQGIEHAPEIVKVCVDSIKRNNNKYEVIIITDENYKNYITFPTWIEEKYKKGIISRTIYSDLLRMNLLATYGGIWIDSTFFCRNSCLESYMKLPLWTIKRPNYGHCSVACGFFANYSLGCSYENRWVYRVFRDFLYNYWKDYNRLVDYLLTDYVIVLAQRHVKQISELFNTIEPNNPYCDELYKILNKPYNDDMWKKINKDTALYKLTWKQNFKKEVDSQPTFYGKLVEGNLI